MPAKRNRKRRGQGPSLSSGHHPLQSPEVSAILSKLLNVDDHFSLHSGESFAQVQFNSEFARRHGLKNVTTCKNVKETVDRISNFLRWLMRSSILFCWAARRAHTRARHVAEILKKAAAVRKTSIAAVFTNWKNEETRQRTFLKSSLSHEPWRQRDRRTIERLAEVDISDDLKLAVVKELYFRERASFYKAEQTRGEKVSAIRATMKMLQGQISKGTAVTSQTSLEQIQEWNNQEEKNRKELRKLFSKHGPGFKFTPEMFPLATLISAWRELQPTLVRRKTIQFSIVGTGSLIVPQPPSPPPTSSPPGFRRPADAAPARRRSSVAIFSSDSPTSGDSPYRGSPTAVTALSTLAMIAAEAAEKGTEPSANEPLLPSISEGCLSPGAGRGITGSPNEKNPPTWRFQHPPIPPGSARKSSQASVSSAIGRRRSVSAKVPVGARTNMPYQFPPQASEISPPSAANSSFLRKSALRRNSSFKASMTVDDLPTYRLRKGSPTNNTNNPPANTSFNATFTTEASSVSTRPNRLHLSSLNTTLQPPRPFASSSSTSKVANLDVSLDALRELVIMPFRPSTQHLSPHSPGSYNYAQSPHSGQSVASSSKSSPKVLLTALFNQDVSPPNHNKPESAMFAAVSPPNKQRRNSQLAEILTSSFRSTGSSEHLLHLMDSPASPDSSGFHNVMFPSK